MPKPIENENIKYLRTRYIDNKYNFNLPIMDISNIQIKKYENNYNLRNNYLKNNTPIKKLEHNYDLRMNNTKPINLDNNTPNKKCENNNDFRNNYLKKYDDDNIQKNNNQINHSPISLQQKNNLNYDYDLKKKERIQTL